MEIRYTLICDGPTDSALLPILNWLLSNAGFSESFHGVWADFRNYSKRASLTLANKIMASLSLYPCELLFIHRDAERATHNTRKREINNAIRLIKNQIPVLPTICVIPVRMTEAWLLFNESAIRYAAGNPNGRIPLSLPRINDLEKLTNPKRKLVELITAASGLSRRRVDDFSFPEIIRQIPEHIDDFSPLRVLKAFSALEQDIQEIVNNHDWGNADVRHRG